MTLNIDRFVSSLTGPSTSSPARTEKRVKGRIVAVNGDRVSVDVLGSTVDLEWAQGSNPQPEQYCWVRMRGTSALGVESIIATGEDSGGGGGPGTPGQAATITVGTTTTLPPGSAATVTNRGDSTNALIDWGIPRGYDGSPGTNGTNGVDGKGFRPIAEEWKGATGGGGTTYDFANAQLPAGWASSASSGQPPTFVSTHPTRSGGISLYSADIGDSQTADLTFSANLAQSGTLSFWLLSQSESNYDFVNFYIDGNAQIRQSGTIGWTQYTYNLIAGNHTFRFYYTKDGSVSTGIDGFYLADVVVAGAGTPAPTYLERDIVRHHGIQWRAVRTNTNVEPGLLATADWAPFVYDGAAGEDGAGFVFRDDYYPGAQYRVGDVFRFNGSTYVTDQDFVSPPDPTYISYLDVGNYFTQYNSTWSGAGMSGSTMQTLNQPGFGANLVTLTASSGIVNIIAGGPNYGPATGTGSLAVLWDPNTSTGWRIELATGSIFRVENGVDQLYTVLENPITPGQQVYISYNIPAGLWRLRVDRLDVFGAFGSTSAPATFGVVARETGSIAVYGVQRFEYSETAGAFPTYSSNYRLFVPKGSRGLPGAPGAAGTPADMALVTAAQAQADLGVTNAATAQARADGAYDRTDVGLRQIGQAPIWSANHTRPGVALGGTWVVPNALVTYYFWVNAWIPSLSRFQLEVVTPVADSTIRIGAARQGSSTTGAPDIVLDAGLANTATAGLKTITVGGPNRPLLANDRGFWLCFKPSHAGIELRAAQVLSNDALGSGTVTPQWGKAKDVSSTDNAAANEPFSSGGSYMPGPAFGLVFPVIHAVGAYKT